MWMTHGTGRNIVFPEIQRRIFSNEIKRSVFHFSHMLEKLLVLEISNCLLFQLKKDTTILILQTPGNLILKMSSAYSLNKVKRGRIG